MIEDGSKVSMERLEQFAARYSPAGSVRDVLNTIDLPWPSGRELVSLFNELLYYRKKEAGEAPQAVDDDRIGIEIRLAPEQTQALDQLMMSCDLAHRAELFNAAMSLFSWAVSAVRDDKAIVAENDEGRETLSFPPLEAAREQARRRRNADPNGHNVDVWMTFELPAAPIIEIDEQTVERACLGYWPLHWKDHISDSDKASIRKHMRKALLTALTGGWPVGDGIDGVMVEALKAIRKVSGLDSKILEASPVVVQRMGEIHQHADAAVAAYEKSGGGNGFADCHFS